MPTALVPYNRFAHAPEAGQYHKATFDAPSSPNPPFATFQHDEKAITFHNIADGNLLQVAAPSVEGAPDMKMKITQTGRNEYRAHYKPDGYTYKVNALYGTKPIQGFPVTMAAKQPHLVQDIPNREFKVHNVYQPHLLSVHTATLPHTAEYDEAKKTVTVKYNLEGGPHMLNSGVHDVHVQYKGEDLAGSRFRLAPKPQPAMAPMMPMMYTQQAYGAPMMQAAPMQPMQYTAPMQAVPAQTVQAGAPMMQAPALMQPVQAAAGYAPMMAAPAGFYAPYPQLQQQQQQKM